MRKRVLADERGAVLLLMALTLPVIVLLLAMSMDFGNWYVHKRQLQNRVDAGALAAGVAYATAFSRCASDTAAAEAEIAGAAKQYAGALGVNGAFNTTPGDATNQLSIVVNDDDQARGPCFNHPANGEFPSPQGGYWTDVKAVAGEVPSFFSGFGVPKPKIAASARVALMTAQTASGMRPLGLVDASSSNCVVALWSSGNRGGSVTLVKQGSDWVGTAPDWPSGTSDMTFSIRVGCTPNDRTYANMAYVTRLPSGAGPALTGLTIVPTTSGTCTNENAYFIPHDGAACQMSLTATFGAAVAASRIQVGNGAIQDLAPNGPNSWTGTFTVQPGSGTGNNRTQPITVQARPTGGGGGGGGGGNFVDKGQASVQAGRASNQGPIANVTLTSHAPANAGSIGQIAVTLREVSSNDLLVIDSGVDCDPGGAPNLHDTFVGGCPGPFRVSTRSSGCDNSAGDNNPPNPGGPFDCVGGTGQNLTSIRNDYNDLWAPGTTCTAKDWPNPTAGDPRLVTIFLSDAIPETQNGSEHYRITGFAAFYVTGWDGSPSPRCDGVNDPEPDDAPDGSLWGHVVGSYVIPPGSGSASGTPCTAGSRALCIAALVK